MRRVCQILFPAAAAVLLALPAAPASAAIEGTTWFPIGPAPIDGFFAGGVSGRATAIAVNPDNPDEIWLGTAAGGVWHSLDGGANWEPESDREDSLAIGAIVPDGCTAAGCSVIYAGTGENAIRRDTYYGAGLLIGEESGGEFSTFSWTQRTGSPFDFRFGSINDVVLDPDTSGATKRIFVTLSSGVTVGAPESTVTAPAPPGGYGIYRSDDKGATWEKLTVNGSNDAKPTDLKMHPDNPDVLFAGFLGRGVFRSPDRGNTWCPLNAGIPPADCPQTLPNVGTTAFDHVEIAIAPSDTQVVYATFGLCTDPLIQNCRPHIWRSEDGGLSWSEWQAGDPDNVEFSVTTTSGYGYSRYTHGLAVDPANANVLLLGGVSIWRFTEGGGGNVTSVRSDATPPGDGQDFVHSDHRDILFHPIATNRAYTVGDGGFAISTDGGSTWEARNDDLQITGFQGIASSPLTTTVIGTSQDNGGQRWTGSRRWRHFPCCGDGGYSILDFDNVMIHYAGSNYGKLNHSIDGGTFWPNPPDFNNGIGSSEPRLFYAPFIQAPSPDGSGKHPLYFGTNRLFKRGKDEVSWTPVSPVRATGPAPEIVTGSSNSSHLSNPGQNVISAIAVSASNPDRIYIGYYGGQVFRSNTAPCLDDECWPSIESGLPDAPVTRIAVHPTDPDTAYITFSGFGSFPRVWKTTNGGTNWNPMVTGLPVGVPANTVSIEPSVPENVFLGLDSGPDGASLFRSENGGGSWSPFNQGLPNVPVYEFSFDETRGRLYAATHGRGAFVLGKPFISNFEGCIDGSVWDIPVYGQNFLPNQPSCTVSILQTNGSVCASGTVDAIDGAVRTDSDGVLETSLVDMWSGKKVVWACLNGDCVGDTPIGQCNDDADSDGDVDPLSTVTVSCGGMLATATVTGCPPLDNPPSSVVELGLSGFAGEGSSELALAEAELPADRGEAGGVLHLVASLQRNVGTRSLCAVAVPFQPGETDETVLARARDAIAASPTCAANGVQAILDPGHAGPSEDEFPRPPRLLLRAPGLNGSQLITALHTDPGRNTGACMRLGEIGVPVLSRLQVMKISLQTPPEGAAGGSVTLMEHSPLGTCSITVPTVEGQSGAEIAAAFGAAFQAPGIPSPHPGCPEDHNPRDIVSVMGFLLSVQAHAIELCQQ